MWDSARCRPFAFGVLALATALLGVGGALAGRPASTSRALAAYAPRLSLSSHERGTSISVTFPADVPTAAFTLYVPHEWAVNSNLPPNTQVPIGTVTAKVAAGDMGGTTLDLSGTVTMVPATTTVTVDGASLPLSTTKTACIGSRSVGAYWLLALTSATQGVQLQVPLYVHTIVPPGFTGAEPEASFADALLAMCLPAPDVPAGAPGRAPFGAKLLGVTLDLSNGLGPVVPGSRFLIHGIATPYVPGAGSANTTGSVEVQTLDATNPALTLTGAAAGKKRSTVSGRLTAGGVAVAKAKVQILVGSKIVGSGVTDKTGRYSTRATLPAAGATLTAKTTVEPRDLPCQAVVIPAYGCVSGTSAGFTVTSKPARVTR